MRTILLRSALALSLAAGPAVAQDYGSADEARAMLEAAVVALEVDEAAALAAFTAGDAPFKDRDLYVFCGGPDGMMTAHGADPDLVGVELRALVDEAGTPFGAAFYDTAVEGEFNTVEYVWPRPGESEPLPKASYRDHGRRANVRRRLLPLNPGGANGEASLPVSSLLNDPSESARALLLADVEGTQRCRH